MNEKEIIIKLLINKYKDEEVTVELAEKILDETKEIMDKHNKSKYPKCSGPWTI
ncbi:hypothetical protein IR083_10065 [Dysgonomonas sp. GY75]|uniref:hypothetical protein n=1 Tax=Dysgonomonas sp. GY75 TaxID=2780419 RepID=UPI001883764F|nr:hypothetical protein [Dysgonomonas sp. GY75]MBF0649165.1 hypothetical protein [Dysgonomonas sp. GY75]